MTDWLTDWLIDADIWTHISKIDWLWWWYNYSTVRCTLKHIFQWLTDWLIDWLIDDGIWTRISMIDSLWWWWYDYSTVRRTNAYIPMTEWLIDWRWYMNVYFNDWLIMMMIESEYSKIYDRVYSNDWLTDWLIDGDIGTRISMIDWLWWWYNNSTVRCTIMRKSNDCLTDWLIMMIMRISMIDWLRWWYNYYTIRWMNAYIPMTDWLIV